MVCKALLASMGAEQTENSFTSGELLASESRTEAVQFVNESEF